MIILIDSDLLSYEWLFIYCHLFVGYLAPDKIDNKFFDPKFAFKEVEVQAKSVTELVTKRKPKVSMGDIAVSPTIAMRKFL